MKNFLKQFGSKAKTDHLERYQQSENWKGKNFKNLSKTTMDISLKNVPKLLKQQLSNREVRSPQSPLPIEKFNSKVWNEGSTTPKFVWYGHSVLLLQINSLNILIDPMLGGDASPIAPFKTKRFSDNSLDVIDDLPPLDAILMTHDHYDHLDYDSIQKLKSKTKTWYVALGVARHLEQWGIPADYITEFDWWDTINFNDIQLTFTPSRHFSGRGAFDRALSLWGGWVFETNSYKIYWSGDSGYDSHFKTIGEKFGKFDWAFMECGQYNKHWHQIHMYPEETVLAAKEVNASIAIPVHWGGFALSLHTWTDPIERFVAESKRLNQEIYTPKIGEIITFGTGSSHKWWEAL